jgi:hypothetical protein
VTSRRFIDAASPGGGEESPGGVQKIKRRRLLCDVDNSWTSLVLRAIFKRIGQLAATATVRATFDFAAQVAPIRTRVSACYQRLRAPEFPIFHRFALTQPGQSVPFAHLSAARDLNNQVL